jgi:methyl-accepting chemotaxis protein
MSRALVPLAALVAGLALVAAGCGGDDQPEVPASTQWAGDLCTAVNTWRNSIATTAADLTTNLSREGLEEAVGEARDTTETLVETVRGLGSPGTESGEEAQDTVSALADKLESSIETIQRSVEDTSGVQGIIEAVSTVSTAVASISAELSSSLDELGGLRDVDDELRQSFDDAEACNGVVPGN